MATRDDPPLTEEQLKAAAKSGAAVRERAWMIRSMAQELLRRRQWEAPREVFEVSPAEQKIIEGIRAMTGGDTTHRDA